MVIGKQYETCDNYEEFKRIVNLKKINVNTVEAGNKISIENGLYFIVLWPSSANMISDNAINNNSLEWYDDSYLLYPVNNKTNHTHSLSCYVLSNKYVMKILT